MARNINQLHPWMQYKIYLLKKECKKQGLQLGIGECFRSVKEQEDLYAKGRSAPGKIVTNARGKSFSSQHQWGIAVDIFQNIRGKEYEDAFMKKVAKIAKSKKVGLSWGGDWKSPVDTPHFYLGKWGSTPSLLKKKYGSFSEFQKEWAAVTKKNCKLWKQKTLRKSKKIKKVPAGSKVAVLYVSKLGYAKIRYQGKYGYIFRSVIR